METIKIYRSIKKDLVIMLICLLFIAFMPLMITNSHASGVKGIIRIIAGWAGLILFGLGFVSFLVLILRQVFFHKPFYVITDDAVKCLQPLRAFEIKFSDVESFTVSSVEEVAFIGIVYKDEIARQKYDASSKIKRFCRRFNVRSVGALDALNASDLSVTPEEFCNLLNDRLKK